MKKTFLIILVLAAAAAGVWLAARGGDIEKDLADIAVEAAKAKVGVAPPARELAPQSLFYYVEMRDLAGRWDRISSSEAWQDLESSNVLEAVAADDRVKDFLDGLHELAAKADMPVTRDNLMKFLGRECAVGLSLDPAAGDPDVLLVTRLDVDALARDMLNGDGDWKALQEEINRRQGSLEFTVTTEPYGDFKLATAVKGELTIVSTQIEDTLVLGTRRDLVTGCLDARAGGGKGSLSKLTEFTQDMDALPRGAFGKAWIHFQGLDVQRQLFASSLRNRGVDEHAVQGALHVLDATKGRGGLAVALDVPDGDLYGLSFDQLSKDGQALFVDPARPDVSALISRDALAYMELRDLKGVLRAWSGSEVKRRLLASHLWRRGEEEAGTTVGQMVGGMQPPVAPGEQVEPPPQISGPFLPRFFGRVLLGQADVLLLGQGAWAVTWAGENGGEPRFDGAVRLDVAGRLAYLAFEGSARYRILNNEVHGMGMAAHRGRTILVALEGADPQIAYAMAGDTLFWSTDLGALKALLDGADYGAPEGARPSLELARRAGFGDDFRAYMHVDADRLGERLARWSDENAGGEMASIVEMFESSLTMDDYGMAAYVDDGFTRFEMRTAVTIGENATPAVRRAVADPGSGPLRAWKLAPADTFLWGGNRMDLEGYWGMIREMLPAGSQGDVDEAVAAIEEPLEMSIDKDILPAVGPEFSVALQIGRAPPTPANMPPGAPPPFAVPGVSVSLQVRNQATIDKLVNRLFDTVNEASRDRFRQSEADPPAPPILVRESHQGVEFVTTAFTDRDREGMPFAMQPALGMADGFLTLTLHADTFRKVLDTAAGRAEGLRDSAIATRAAGEGADLDARNVMLFDWNGFVGQLAEYREHLGGLVPEAEMPDFPDWPENDDQEEWARRIKVYEEQRVEGAERGAAALDAYFESLRLVEYVVSTSASRDGLEVGSMVVRFPD